jgi:hypothetical protein
MALITYPAFNYGHNVTSNNNYINFSEGGPEISATIAVGSYTLGSFINAISVAMNAVGGQAYSISLNRLTRKITISAPSNFELLINTGSQNNISAYDLMGFTGPDLLGSNSYEGDSASGSQYRPQFLLQGFVDFEDDQRKASAVVNESASGLVQVSSYGDVKTMSCNITLATNITPQIEIIENPTGVSDLRSFMEYAINKYDLEFIPDAINNPSSNIRNCLLEKTPESKDGTAFILKELYARNLTGYFETGNIQFREI